MDNFGNSIMDTIEPLPNCPTGPVGNRIYGLGAAVNYQRFEGDWAEFGVYQGDTARALLPHLGPDSKFYLFDSYEGLAREWSGLPAQSFRMETPPIFTDERVVMHNGWFEDTVREPLEDSTLAFIHIDCDLYESTLDALWQLPPLRSGTIILFDEYVHNLGGKPVDDEHRAFTEWVDANNYKWKYLWRTAWTQVCVEIL